MCKEVDYCGVMILLQTLVAKGIITEKEKQAIAARVSSVNGITVIFPH